MIKTTMELLPYGSERGKKSIGYVYIFNCGGKNTDNTYGYIVHQPYSAFSEEFTVGGYVTGWDRNNAAVDLLCEVMKAYSGVGSIPNLDEYLESVWKSIRTPKVEPKKVVEDKSMETFHKLLSGLSK